MTTRDEIEALIKRLEERARDATDSYSTGYWHGAADFAEALRGRLSSMKDDANG